MLKCQAIHYSAICVENLSNRVRGTGDAEMRLVIGIVAKAATFLVAIQANIKPSLYAAKRIILYSLLIFQKKEKMLRAGLRPKWTLSYSAIDATRTWLPKWDTSPAKVTATSISASHAHFVPTNMCSSKRLEARLQIWTARARDVRLVLPQLVGTSTVQCATMRSAANVFNIDNLFLKFNNISYRN